MSLSLGLGCNGFLGLYLKGNLFTQGKTNERGIGVKLWKLWSSLGALSEPNLGVSSADSHVYYIQQEPKLIW